jgi:hypothetical protein
MEATTPATKIRIAAAAALLIFSFAAGNGAQVALMTATNPATTQETS